jgi:hypothetical protein
MPWRVRRGPSKEVAVVVPLSSQPGFTPDEEIGLRHLRHYLGAYDRYMIAPRGMAVDAPDFQIVRVSPRYFGSLDAHTRMLMSPRFYERFRDYRYILFHHLDAIVFSDELRDWCARDFDFIGAPNVSTAAVPAVVYNGGFSLRKVESFLKVFYSTAYAVDPELYWKAVRTGRSRPAQLAALPLKYLKRLRFFNNVRRDIRLFLREPRDMFEDMWFGDTAQKYYPDFRLPPPDEARLFAFDQTPRAWFELTGGRLPFGAHAWFKQDRAFYEPFLLPADSRQRAQTA